jgi:hypothetical protein
MLSNQQIRPYVFAFLAFCVLSSKHIIIYNEETLVALSFLAFVIFSFHYFGNTIKESLNERSESIKIELQNFLAFKQSSLSELLKEYQKGAQLNTALNYVLNITNKEIFAARKNTESALKTIFSNQMQQKLNTYTASKSNLQQNLQQLMAANILSAVLVKYQSLKKKAGKKSRQLSPKIIKFATHFQ